MGVGGSKRKRLSRDDLEFLKARTSYDDDTIRKWHKGFRIDCPSGKLTPRKFVEMYKLFFPHGNAQEFCDHVFRTFDTDKNGFIDFKEFLLAIDVTSAGSPTDKLKWAFKMYDVDGNGVIDLEEMTKIVQAIYDVENKGAIYDMMGGEQTTCSAESRAEEIFQRMDANQDGSLTEEEFLTGCLSDKELSKLLAPNA